MKKIIITIVTFITINHVNANSDSLTCVSDSNYCVEIIDSNIVEVESEVTLEITQNKNVKKLENKKVKTKDNLLKPANLFDDAWDWFTYLFKPVHGYYTEDGQRTEGPYFLFDRKENNNIN